MRRARRFAGFYLGEDPEAPNYDPRHRIVRSAVQRQQGAAGERQLQRRPLQHRARAHHPRAWLGRHRPRSGGRTSSCGSRSTAASTRWSCREDVTVNLGIVPLVATAFLYTGEERCRRWIEEYAGAWIERTRANGGIVPDNVGRSGIVGETRDGEWWGGFYGWTGRFGHQMMSCAVTVAAEAALLVTGDEGYLDLPRMHLDTLIAHAREEEGRLLVPHKHTSDGWCEFGPAAPHMPVHLWAASMAAEDRDRLDALRRGREEEWAGVTRRPVARRGRPRLDALPRRRGSRLSRAHPAGELPRGLQPARQGPGRRAGSDRPRRPLVAAGQPGGDRGPRAADHRRPAAGLLGWTGPGAGALLRPGAAAPRTAPGRRRPGDAAGGGRHCPDPGQPQPGRSARPAGGRRLLRRAPLREGGLRRRGGDHRRRRLVSG